MTFLPIVDRELRVAARAASTYRNRSIVAGIVAMIAMVMFAFGAFAAVPSRTGHSMFWTLAYLALFFCLFEGVRKTADCLSEEKRDGTLGLLFLTDLRGHDVILGKLAGKSLTSVYGLLSVLPILALALLLGGVTGGEYWRIVLALLNILFFSLCTGIFVSGWHRDDQKAMATTLLVIGLGAIVPLFAPNFLSNFSPIRAFNAADDGSYFLNPQNYWWSIVTVQGLSWIMLLWAALAVPYCWREEKLGRFSFNVLRFFPAGRRMTSRRAIRERQYMLARNPIFWLAARDTAGPIRFFILIFLGWGVAVALAFCFRVEHLMTYMGICWVTNFLLKMRVAAQACHCFAEARRNKALEMLLVTPLNSESIIRGQILALQRTFFVPLVIMLVLELIGLMTGVAVLSRHQNDDSIGFVIIGYMGYLALFVLDVCAVAWAGMWYGLSCKTEGAAVTKTILLVLVLPMLCLLVVCYGFPFVIGLPIMFMANSSSNLRRKFRDLAGQRYNAPAHANWTPAVIPVPPKI